MNIVIAAEKKYNKLFTNCLAFGRHNLIGYETEMKPNFVKKIAEHYNPHILIVLRGVRSKKFDFLSSLDKLLRLRPNLRIIYLFGKVNEKNTDEYFKTVELFKSYNIYDIVPFDPYERGFSSKFSDLLETPLTEEGLQEIMESVKPEDNVADIFINQKIEKIVDQTPINITKAEIENPNYGSKVITVDEAPERLDEDVSEHITIAVGTISDRQAGCTLTSFELAVTLGQLKQTAAVFLDDETYNNYVSYHGLIPSEARKGCEINGITIYPLELYEDKNSSVRFSICDYGYSQINRDSAEFEEFSNAQIKICICSFNEWDINILADYLNSSLPYIKDINYVFFPVSQMNFAKFQKQMTKGHCKAFRIRNSPDYTLPCDWNKGVYYEIISKYVQIENVKKRFNLF